MKVIIPVHKWYKDHPKQKPAKHIANIGEMHPICGLMWGSIKVDKWKRVFEDPTCPHCIAIAKNRTRVHAQREYAEKIVGELKEFLLDRKTHAVNKLRGIADNIPDIIKKLDGMK